MTALRERQILFQTLRRITNLITGERELDRIYASVLDCAIQVLGAEAAYLVTGDEGRTIRVIRRRAHMSQGDGLEKVPHSDGGLVRLALESGRPVVASPAVKHPSHDPAADGVAGIRMKNIVAVPYLGRHQRSGVLVILNSLRLGEGLVDELDTLSVLVNQTAVAEENFRLCKRLEQLAITDELTQVYNYRFLKTALRKEVKRAARFGLEFSVLMVDVDNLKKYNEANGHLRGSQLLKAVASILTRDARETDLVAKYGGDEFMLILPQTGPEGAQVMANRVRRAVEIHTFPNVDEGEITISVGISSYPVHGQTVDRLIARADAALFMAKRGGRNRVVRAG